MPDPTIVFDVRSFTSVVTPMFVQEKHNTFPHVIREPLITGRSYLCLRVSGGKIGVRLRETLPTAETSLHSLSTTRGVRNWHRFWEMVRRVDDARRRAEA